jgi:hypothetical protein
MGVGVDIGQAIRAAERRATVFRSVDAPASVFGERIFVASTLASAVHLAQ